MSAPLAFASGVYDRPVPPPVMATEPLAPWRHGGDRQRVPVDVVVVAEHVDRGRAAVLVEGLRVVDGVGLVVDRGDRHVDGAGVRAAVAVADRVREGVGAGGVRVRLVGQAGAAAGDRDRALGALRDGGDRQRVALGVGVVGERRRRPSRRRPRRRSGCRRRRVGASFVAVDRDREGLRVAGRVAVRRAVITTDPPSSTGVTVTWATPCAFAAGVNVRRPWFADALRGDRRLGREEARLAGAEGDREVDGLSNACSSGAPVIEAALTQPGNARRAAVLVDADVAVGRERRRVVDQEVVDRARDRVRDVLAVGDAVLERVQGPVVADVPVGVRRVGPVAAPGRGRACRGPAG